MVDDYPLSACGLVSVLGGADGIVAAAGPDDPKLAVQAVVGADADVLVIGLGRRAQQWLAACARVRHRSPSTRVLIICHPNGKSDIADLLSAGATGLLPRSVTPEQAVDAVRATASGRSLIAPDLAGRLLDELSAAAGLNQSGPPGGLTRREREVLRLMGEGLPNREVAARLRISENTVKNHVRNIHGKLGVRTRTEAVVTAARSGLLGIRPADAVD